MVVRLKLSSDSPVDVFRSAKHQVDEKEQAPKWLFQKPYAYVQQIRIHTEFDEANVPECAPEVALKQLLSPAFLVKKLLGEVSSLKERSFESLCFHVHENKVLVMKGFPSGGCLQLSPSLFWINDQNAFQKDGNVLKTIFSTPCSTGMCLRELFLGMPIAMTGIKKTYQRDRHVVSLTYAATLFLEKYDEGYITTLRKRFSKNFEVTEPSSSEELSFLRVFYRPHKHFIDFIPLVSSYVLLMFYIYFSVSKIVMVKSKWGLALAAVVTVAASSTMTAGICIHFDLMPTLWGAELFPYLALVVGLENTLCLTRSVVYTPPTMDVPSRLSHGLSQEGYSFTKYFLLEMAFLSIGFLTFVSEIQEFCIFAFIALVIDFYMQLMFYAPCLTFDLLRLDHSEKQLFSSMLFYSDIRRYKNYQNPVCPMLKFWPRLFSKKLKLFRVKSDPQLRDHEANNKGKLSGHRRTTSSIQIDRASNQSSARIRLLYFWTRTRFVQRAGMIVFVLWTIWIGFIVQNWRSEKDAAVALGRAKPPLDVFAAGKANDISGGEKKHETNHVTLEHASPLWKDWQRRTFRVWPTLFDKYNLSLSGHYITLLPVIDLKIKIWPNNTNLFYNGDAFAAKGTEKDQKTASPSLTESLLLTRIYDLETRMAFISVVCGILLFATVGGFLLYVCFWRRTQRELDAYSRKEFPTANESGVVEGWNARKFLTGPEPVLFSGHKSWIECVEVMNPNITISSCSEGQVLVWDVTTGKKIMAINRKRDRLAYESMCREKTRGLVVPQRNSQSNLTACTNVSAAGDNKESGSSAFASSTAENQEDCVPQVWCIAVRQGIIFLGCADGTVEIADSETGSLIGIYGKPHSEGGVVHILVRSGRLALARLSGAFELLDVCFSVDKPLALQSIKQVSCIRIHRLAIRHFKSTALKLITIYPDRLIRVFDIRSCRLEYTLKGHNTTIISMCVDHMSNMLYTSCQEGIICLWDLERGQLARTINDVSVTKEVVELACTASMLLGYSSDGHLWIWDKNTGQLHTRITPDCSVNNSKFQKRCLTVVNNQIAATSCGTSILFWDLSYKVMAKRVQIEGHVDKLLSLNQKSVICCSARTLYRIDVPVIRFS